MSNVPIATWMQRKVPGFIFNSWKKEWYVLSDDLTTFIRSESPSTKAHPVEYLTSQIIKVTKLNSKSFEISFQSGETFQFRCYYEKELSDWVTAFNNILAQKNAKAVANIPREQSNSKDNLDPIAKTSSATDRSDTAGEGTPSRKSKAATRKSAAQQRKELPSGVPQEALSGARSNLMGEIKGSNSNNIKIGGADVASKKDAVLMDNTVFMGKARNFAVSTGKQFIASAKAKGVSFDYGNSTIEEGAEGVVGGAEKKRKAVVPSYVSEENVEPERFNKTPEQKEKLCKIVETALEDFLGGNLFKELESEAVVDLMYVVNAKRGDPVIQQGEPTSSMFVIESGKFGIYTQDFINKPPEFVEEKKPGDVFGALSLLYNQPGPFTVKAMQDGVIWALPRKKFHDLSTLATKRRAGRKVRLLEGVPLIADNLDRSNVVALADAMFSTELEDGEYIVKAGESLKKMILIGEGTALMLTSENVPIGDLNKGEAFGEWALLDIGAKADVSLVAKSNCTIMTLEVSEVEELVGPLRDYVTRRWAEERGDQFFFNNNGARGGTLFNQEVDVRNPVSKAPKTLAFTSTKATTTTTTTNDQTTENNEQSSPVPTLTKEQSDEVVAMAIEEARNRKTGVNRKTKAKVEPPAVVSPPVIDNSHEKSKEEAERLAAEKKKADEIAAEERRKAEEAERNRPKGADEVDDDSEGEEEDNLDMPFVPAKPLRPELILSAITPCALLGKGNFGRVHLCRNEANHVELFALKVLSRHFIVQNGWEVLVENERNAMLELSSLTKSPFLLKLFHSYSDSKNIYLLLELCQGGDLYNLLRVTQGNRFSEETALFYMAGVTLGLEAMHSRTIIYRDLKPENLMLDRQGMVKIADFGLAKKTIRTYTVCGTPDYMAPEVILSRGHAAAVDWWAIGVLLYEMVGAATPFFGNEAMDVYELILEHIEEDDLKFPSNVNFSPAAKSLIKKLLHPKKTKRLGITHPGVLGVKQHPFFKGFDWNEMENLRVPPPVKPHFVDMTKYTTGNAPHGYDSKISATPDDNSGWTLKF